MQESQVWVLTLMVPQAPPGKAWTLLCYSKGNKPRNIGKFPPGNNCSSSLLSPMEESRATISARSQASTESLSGSALSPLKGLYWCCRDSAGGRVLVLHTFDPCHLLVPQAMPRVIPECRASSNTWAMPVTQKQTKNNNSILQPVWFVQHLLFYCNIPGEPNMSVASNKILRG